MGLRGSANFLTGIGGFLQVLLNGYGGIRLRSKNSLTYLEILGVNLPPTTQEMVLNGNTKNLHHFQL